MEFRRIGNSGLKVSEIGLGCGTATFAGNADEQTSLAIIHQALELGITYFDTAETYADGRSETLLGKALKGMRSKVVIGTKFAKDRSVGPSEQRGSRRRVMMAVEGSLKRLATDYIDLYVMHEPDPGTPIEETLRALDDLVRVGKVRYLGCSDFSGWQLCEALWTSRMHGLESFVAAGSHYNLIDRHLERELIPCCRNFGVGVAPTMPLAQGFLTGKYRRDGGMPETGRFTSKPPFAGEKHQNLGRYDKYLNDANFEKLARLEAFAQQCGRSVAELAIAWLLSHPWIGTVPVGCTSGEQLTRNVASAGWKLSSDDLVQLNKII
jgi:aryl-alcohol dehydrogenase-like predicted oxidoreductase